MKLRKNNRLWDVSLDEAGETEQPSSRLKVEDQGLNPKQRYAQKGTETDSLRGYE